MQNLSLLPSYPPLSYPLPSLSSLPSYHVNHSPVVSIIDGHPVLRPLHLGERIAIEWTRQIHGVIDAHCDADVTAAVAVAEIRRLVYVDVEVFALLADQVSRDAVVVADVAELGVDDGQALTVERDADATLQLVVAELL